MIIENIEKKEWIKVRTKELDEYQDYVKEYSGRLTTTLGRVKQITELMNEGMSRRNILIKMELPLDKEEIPF